MGAVMTNLKVTHGSKRPPATIEQIAAIEFMAIPELARMSKAQRKDNAKAMASRVWNAAAVAAEFVSLDKVELVKRVAEKPDYYGPMLMEFAYAADDARALLEVIQACETRLAVALAVVEGDEPPDPDDGEKVAA
jgi:hypothetical protein